LAVDGDHPLEIIERAVEVLQFALGDSAKAVNFRILGIEPDQQAIVGNRMFKIAGGEIGLGPVRDRSSMAGIALNRLSEIADGAIGISLLQIGEAAAEEIFDLFRADLDRTIVIGDDGVGIAMQA